MALQASRILLEVFISIPLGQSSTPQSVKKTIQRLLTQRKPVELIEKDLYEMHIKGSGPGTSTFLCSFTAHGLNRRTGGEQDKQRRMPSP